MTLPVIDYISELVWPVRAVEQNKSIGWQIGTIWQIHVTVKTLNIGTPRPATVVVLNIKPFNFTMK